MSLRSGLKTEGMEPSRSNSPSRSPTLTISPSESPVPPDPLMVEAKAAKYKILPLLDSVIRELQYQREDNATSSPFDINEPPDMSAAVFDKLEWCFHALSHVLGGDSAPNAAEFESKLTADLLKGARDKNMSNWFGGTFTENVAAEKSRLAQASQASFRRSTIRRSQKATGPGRSRLGGGEGRKVNTLPPGFSLNPNNSMLSVIASEDGPVSPPPVRNDLLHASRMATPERKAHNGGESSSDRSPSPSTRGKISRETSFSKDVASLPVKIEHHAPPQITLMDDEGPEYSLERLLAHYEHDRECYSALEGISSWDLDVFRIAHLTADRPLTFVAMKIMIERGLLDSLKLNPHTLLRFFVTIEDHYGRFPAILYHNNAHAADVMHSVHYQLDTPCFEDAFSDVEIFSALIAGAVHDVEHNGNTNTYHVKTSSPFAILYNDASVLENHHIATAFKIMQNDDCNILKNFEKEDRLLVRKMMIDMVLGTDMVKHTKSLAHFKAFSKQTHDEINDPAFPISSIREKLQNNHEDRLHVLCAMVHNGDLANPTKRWDLCEKWTARIMEEFWREGDQERAMGLDIGALNDRKKIYIPKAQLGFINFVVAPLWQSWRDFVSPGQDIVQLTHIKENVQTWEEHEKSGKYVAPASETIPLSEVASYKPPSDHAKPHTVMIFKKLAPGGASHEGEHGAHAIPHVTTSSAPHSPPGSPALPRTTNINVFTPSNSVGNSNNTVAPISTPQPSMPVPQVLVSTDELSSNSSTNSNGQTSTPSNPSTPNSKRRPPPNLLRTGKHQSMV